MLMPRVRSNLQKNFRRRILTLQRARADVAAHSQSIATMQWTVQDKDGNTDHAGLESVLQNDIEALKVAGGTMDIREVERRGFESVRKQMDSEARLAKGVECKSEANNHFAGKDWMQALIGYVAGIWFLQRGDPPCPAVIASATDAAAFAAVPASLGAGAPSPGEKALSAELEAERLSLCVALHLNLAAAALKLSRFAIAKTACQYVLMVEGNKASPKARYRLAKALEGEGEVSEACSVLESLLKADASNADAQKLLEELKPRAAELEAAAAKEVDYETMGPEEWAKLSPEEQQRALDAINRKLDEEMGEESGSIRASDAMLKK